MDCAQNDVLQWIIEEAIRQNHSDVSIVEHMFLINFAAIHTSSNERVFSSCPFEKS